MSSKMHDEDNKNTIILLHTQKSATLHWIFNYIQILLKKTKHKVELIY